MPTPKRLAAELRDSPPKTTASTNPLAKIIGKRHPRRLLPAAAIINQNSTDSGIPQSIQSVRIPL